MRLRQEVTHQDIPLLPVEICNFGLVRAFIAIGSRYHCQRFQRKTCIFPMSPVHAETTWPIENKFCIIDYVHEMTQGANCLNWFRGCCSPYVKYKLFGILYFTLPYTFFSWERLQCRPVRSTDFWRPMAQKTRFGVRKCLLRVLLSNHGKRSKIAKIPNLSGVANIILYCAAKFRNVSAQGGGFGSPAI